MAKEKTSRRRRPLPVTRRGLLGGVSVGKVAGMLVVLGLLGSGYLGFDTWKTAYHATFALAGDVKQQVDGLKALYLQSQDLQIQTQINGLNTEKRVVIRQISDLRLKLKHVKAEDRDVFDHVIRDLEQEVKIIDDQIRALRNKQNKQTK